MAAGVSIPDFAESERSFVLGRMRILIWLGIAVLGTYLVLDVQAFGWRSTQVAYRLLAELTLIATLGLRGTAFARRHVDLIFFFFSAAIGTITLASTQNPVGAREIDAALLVFHAARFAMIVLFVANAVTLPARWHVHVAVQLSCFGFFFLRWPDVFATLAGADQLVWMTMGLAWIAVICDVSVFLYSRLQRSEFEAKRELEEVSLQRQAYLDGLVRVGISATSSDPALQARAVLAELLRQLGAERAYLYLVEGAGTMTFQAGRSAAGLDLDPPERGSATAHGLISVPLRMHEQVVGEILLERPSGADSAASSDFLRALASHAAIALETARSTEELRVARDRALEAGRAKDAFLRTMSHELRTPLNAMIGYSEMLVEDLEDANDTEHATDARRVHGAAAHLLGIIADILELTKIEADRSGVVATEFPVADVVRSVESAIRPEAERNENRLEIEIASDVGSISSDRDRVELILKKLLENACKFTRKGTIGCAVDCERHDGVEWIRFRLSDTGIGMTGDQLARCFEPFYQADLSATREYGGAGLGLTTAIRLCEMLGGAISARSSPGEGSTFEVTLPRVFDAAGAADDAS